MSPYKSERRRLQAETTQRDILRAARLLFARDGYQRTSMNAIAREAGVVVQTVYNAAGPKQDILRRMNDFVEEEAGVTELARQLAATVEPREMLRVYVRLTARVAENCGDIIAALDSASRIEPETTEVSREGRRRHREGARGVAESLAQAGALPPGMSTDRSAQLLAVMTYNDTYLQLTTDHGLSFGAAEDLVLSTLESLFFAQ